MSSIPRTARHCGFTIMEMVAVLMLLAVFSFIMSEAMAVTLHAGQDARVRDFALHNMDMALAELRGDTWSATALRAKDSHLEIDGPAGTITWDWRKDDEAGRLVRQAPGSTEASWKEFPAIRFGAGGPLLTVTVTTGKSEEYVTFPSQQLLAGGRR
jgi:prepilin-type N-terminal cleavage/methylation domain-containing protein